MLGPGANPGPRGRASENNYVITVVLYARRLGLLACLSLIAQIHIALATNMNPIVVPARSQHSATVIVLHGLGDSGAGWSSVAGQLDFPWVKFIFPSAAPRPVTIQGGAMCPAWADIKGLSPDSPEDVEGSLETRALIHSLVTSEVSSGIPASRIVIGGFSQGAAMVSIVCDLVYS